MKSCATIVTEANEFVRSIHDRMPAILERGDFHAWLTGGAGSIRIVETRSERPSAKVAGIEASEQQLHERRGCDVD